MKLAIISHTPHYKKNGKIVGWGPTVREINHLAQLFDEIYHAAPLHNDDPPGSSLSYESQKIKFIPLKAYGGVKLQDKLSILTTMPYNLKIIRSVLDKVDWVQFRAPTAMGIYVLPYLIFRKKPKRWVKYAGNWNMQDAPLSYRFQKWLLNKYFTNSKVTINGLWEGQKKHFVNFQNPCLDKEELERATKIAEEKNFNNELVLCFAGSLTKNKGVELILESLKHFKDKNAIKKVIFAGDGPKRKYYEKIAADIGLPVAFTGFISRAELENIYKVSHIILLPSESEGFPKVISEAAAYGCVPIVSDISFINQYFNDTNGFLLKKLTVEDLNAALSNALNDRIRLKDFSRKCSEIARLFTFENYNNRILNEIIKD